MKINVASIEQCPLFKTTNLISKAVGIRATTDSWDGLKPQPSNISSYTGFNFIAWLKKRAGCIQIPFLYFGTLRKFRSYRGNGGTMLKADKVFDYFVEEIRP